MLKKILLLAVTGSALVSWSAYAGIQGPASPYTHGAKAATFDVYSDGANSFKFDVYSDGKFNVYSDGAKSSRFDVYGDGN